MIANDFTLVAFSLVFVSGVADRAYARQLTYSHTHTHTNRLLKLFPRESNAIIIVLLGCAILRFLFFATQQARA